MRRDFASHATLLISGMLFDSSPFILVPAGQAQGTRFKHNGSTAGGHVFELKVNPTFEVFVTVKMVPLKKSWDDASWMKLIHSPL